MALNIHNRAPKQQFDPIYKISHMIIAYENKFWLYI